MKYACATPIHLKQPDGFKQLAPCGHCHGCITRRQMAWTLRICLEASTSVSSSCLTLTYAEDTRPGKLEPEHISLFMRRLRKITPEPIRFFSVGEYGTVSGREHWHLILFGSPYREKGLLRIEQWPHGGVYCDAVTPQAAAYVARYSLKTGAKGGDYIARMSRNPGIGVDAIGQIGAHFATRARHVDRIPRFWRMGDRMYPLDKTACTAFQRAYERNGGHVRVRAQKLILDLEERISVIAGDFSDLAGMSSVGLRRLELEEVSRGTF